MASQVKNSFVHVHIEHVITICTLNEPQLIPAIDLHMLAL